MRVSGLPVRKSISVVVSILMSISMYIDESIRLAGIGISITVVVSIWVHNRSSAPMYLVDAPTMLCGLSIFGVGISTANARSPSQCYSVFKTWLSCVCNLCNFNLWSRALIEYECVHSLLCECEWDYQNQMHPTCSDPSTSRVHSLLCNHESTRITWWTVMIQLDNQLSVHCSTCKNQHLNVGCRRDKVTTHKLTCEAPKITETNLPHQAN